MPYSIRDVLFTLESSVLSSNASTLESSTLLVSDIVVTSPVD